MVQSTENTYLFSAYANFSTVLTFKLASLERSPSKPSKTENQNEIFCVTTRNDIKKNKKAESSSRNYPMNRGRQEVRLTSLPEPSELGGLVVRGVKNFARRNKVISGSYLIGILAILLIGSGTKLTYDQKKQYNAIMNTVDLQAEFDASSDYWVANQAYRASKGWFSCNSVCQRNKKRMEKAKYKLDQIHLEGEARMSDAKSVAGLFSEVGVAEVQDSFWGHFANGKQFAKRQSMWDAFFMSFRSMRRDEKFFEYAMNVLMQVLVNFSMGLIMALFFFVIGLWSIVRSYQANPIVAVLTGPVKTKATLLFVKMDL